MLVGRDDPQSRPDLRTQRRLLDGRADHVGRERDVGGLEREALHVLLRGQRFDLPPVQTEHVRHESDADLAGVEGVIGGYVMRFVIGIFQTRQKIDAVALNADGRARIGVAGHLVALGLKFRG